MAVNSIIVRLLVIEITFMVLAVVNSYPTYGSDGYKHKIRDKGRSIRGFKNMDLATARGFGKRTDRGHYDVVNFSPSDVLADAKDDKDFSQIGMLDMDAPLKNRYLARSLVEKIIDANHDGYISVNELLQPMESES